MHTRIPQRHIFDDQGFAAATAPGLIYSCRLFVSTSDCFFMHQEVCDPKSALFEEQVRSTNYLCGERRNLGPCSPFSKEVPSCTTAPSLKTYFNMGLLYKIISEHLPLRSAPWKDTLRPRVRSLEASTAVTLKSAPRRSSLCHVREE